MQYIDASRDTAVLKNGLAELRRIVTHPWVLMEIFGGQTHSIMHGRLVQVADNAFVAVWVLMSMRWPTFG
jgi:hydrogenase expression/formation protein HypD